MIHILVRRAEISRLALLCSHHHHLVHEGGFGLALAPDGELDFTRPDGSEIMRRGRASPELVLTT